MTLARRSKPQEALQAFEELIPVLLTASGGSDDDAGSTAAAREGRVRFVIEGYLRLLTLNPSIASGNVADETFSYASVCGACGCDTAIPELLIAERAELLAKGDALRSELATASTRLAAPAGRKPAPSPLTIGSSAATSREDWRLSEPCPAILRRR